MMFQLLVALAVFLPGLQAFQYTGELHEGDVIYACQNATVSLPWQILVTSFDNITYIQWSRRRGQVEMLGMSIEDSFVAFPGYTNKVSHSRNASITLYNVEPNDSGYYTVQVTGFNTTGHHYQPRQTVYVHISGRPRPCQTPVLDRAYGLWSIQLTCGEFTFKGQQPPYDVQWTIPGVGVRNSSKYENGQFYLPLNRSMQSGTYTCRVPLNESCLSVDDATYGEDSLYLDSMDIRLAVFEKENEPLKFGLQEATRDVMQLKIRSQEAFNGFYHLENEIEQLKVRLEGVTGPIRLVGGRNEREGRVEIRVGKTWGTVCDDGWDSNDAKVVCNMLGYFQPGAQATTDAYYSQGTGQIVLAQVGCNSRESDIRLCIALPFGASNCHHNEDAGVICVG